MKEKRDLRKEMLSVLGAIDDSDYAGLSASIADRLYRSDWWQHAETIGITISRRPEVDTYQIIQRAWEEGKRVAVPKCIPESRELQFRYLTDFSQLETVYYGLLEPEPNNTALADQDLITLLIVPGIAFTKKGCRLGFGGGYYDRFLPRYSGKTASLAFECQLIDEMPVEKHDIPVSAIITDKQVITV